MKNFLKWFFGVLLGILVLGWVFAAITQWNNSKQELSQKRMYFTDTGSPTGNVVADINTGGKIIMYGQLRDWSGGQFITGWALSWYLTWSALSWYLTGEKDPIFIANSWLFYRASNASWFIWGSWLTYNSYTLNINWPQPGLILWYTWNIVVWSAITVSWWYTSQCISQTVVNLTWTIPSYLAPNTTYIIKEWTYNISSPILLTWSCIYLLWDWKVYLSWSNANWIIVSSNQYNIIWNLYMIWASNDMLLVTWTNNNAIIAVNIRWGNRWILVRNSNYITIKDSNILSNIIWISLLTVNYSYINNIKSFNNTQNWIFINPWTYNTISNSAFFNNTLYWYIVQAWSNNVLSNSNMFNNWSNWIRVVANNFLHKVKTLNNTNDTYISPTTWYDYIETSSTSISPNVKYWSSLNPFVSSVWWSSWYVVTWVVITWYNTILPFDELWNPLYDVNTWITVRKWAKTFIWFPSSYTIWTGVWLYNPITWVSFNVWLTWLINFNEFITSTWSSPNQYWNVWTIIKDAVTDLVFKNWTIDVLRISTWWIYWIWWSKLVDENYFSANSLFYWDYDYIYSRWTNVKNFSITPLLNITTSLFSILWSNNWVTWSVNILIWSKNASINWNNNITIRWDWVIISWSNSNLVYWWWAWWIASSWTILDNSQWITALWWAWVYKDCYWSYTLWSFSCYWSYFVNMFWAFETPSPDIRYPYWTWMYLWRDPIFHWWKVVNSDYVSIFGNWFASWAKNSIIMWGGWVLLWTSWTILFSDSSYNSLFTGTTSYASIFNFKNWVLINNDIPSSNAALNVSGWIQTNDAYYIWTWLRITASGNRISLQYLSWSDWIEQ